MVLQISVKDEKAELFLQLVEALKSNMIEKFQILSSEGDFDEEELINRVNDVKYNKLKTLTREEVFDGIC